MAEQRRPHLAPDKARAFVGLIRAGEELDRRLDAELQRKHGLSLRAFEVLLFLAEFSDGGTERMANLIARTPLSQSRVSRLVADLETRGWVERHPSVDDGRGVEVSITAAGRAKFREAQPGHLEDLDRLFFDRLSQSEIRQIGSITAKLMEGTRHHRSR